MDSIEHSKSKELFTDHWNSPRSDSKRGLDSSAMQNSEAQQNFSYQREEAVTDDSQSCSPDRDHLIFEDDELQKLPDSPRKEVAVHEQSHLNNGYQHGCAMRNASASILFSASSIPTITQSNPESPKPDNEFLRDLRSPTTGQFSHEDGAMPQLRPSYRSLGSPFEGTYPSVHSLEFRSITSEPVSLSDITSAARTRIPRTAMTTTNMHDQNLLKCESSSPEGYGLQVHHQATHSPSSGDATYSSSELSHASLTRSRSISAQHSYYDPSDLQNHGLPNSIEQQRSVYTLGSETQQLSSPYPAYHQHEINHHPYLTFHVSANGQSSGSFINSSTHEDIQASYPNNIQPAYYVDHEKDYEKDYDPNAVVYNNSPKYSDSVANPHDLTSRVPSLTQNDYPIQSSERGTVHGSSPLKYTSLAAWENSQVTSHRNSRDRGDPTFPNDPRWQLHYTRVIHEAMLDDSQAEDNPGMRDTWDRLSSKSEDIESACWKLLKESMRFFREGDSIRPSRRSNRRAQGNFRAHITELTAVMREQKTICKHVMAEEYIRQFVKDPSSAGMRVKNNRKVNGGKKVTIDVGKETIAKNPDLVRRSNSARRPRRSQISDQSLDEEQANIGLLQQPVKAETQPTQYLKNSRTKKRKTEAAEDPEYKGTAARGNARRKVAKESIYPLVTTRDGKTQILDTSFQPHLQRHHQEHAFAMPNDQSTSMIDNLDSNLRRGFNNNFIDAGLNLSGMTTTGVSNTLHPYGSGPQNQFTWDQNSTAPIPYSLQRPLSRPSPDAERPPSPFQKRKRRTKKD